MKLTTLLLVSLFALLGTACTRKEKPQANNQNNLDSITMDSILIDSNSTSIAPSLYDAALAERLGGDEYGMKKYILAFLKTGPNRTEDKEEAQKLQLAHMQNIERLAEAGKLVVAGPFFEEGDLRGIYIFNVETKEEAEALVNSDPAIQAGSLVMELHAWYSSAALVDINNVHKKLSKKSITE